MTTKNYLLILFFTLIFGCSKDNTDCELQAYAETPKPSSTTDAISQEYDNAVDIINMFYSRINKDDSSTKSTLIPNLVLSNTKALQIDVPSTKSANNTQIDSVNIFTFDLNIDGDQGFVIASGDERIGRVYAFVNKGSLADTSEISGMAQMIRNIPKLIKQDIEIYNSAATTKSALTSFEYGPHIETK